MAMRENLIVLLVACFLVLTFQSPVLADTVLYDYDDLGRLILLYQEDGYTITQIDYQYDDVGNIMQHDITTQTMDTDGDQMPDGWETLYGLNPNDPGDANQDPDNDGLTNLEEYNHNTDPTRRDTDGDGFSDGDEVRAGTDPLNIDDHPVSVAAPAAGPVVLALICFVLAYLGYKGQRNRSRSFIAALFLVPALLIPTLNAHADPLGPGWFNPQGQLVSPADAKAYYDSLAARNNASKGIVTRAINAIMDFLGLSTQGSEAIATPSISELARALKNDPTLIYEYVRNHVDYVPYYGSLKGATLTYLDGAGNDFDQASLMIALLRQSGYTADYVYGQMTIPAYGDPNQKDMQHWLCTDADNTVIEQVLADGGIPASQDGSSWTVDRVWVQATINGSAYVFDPAFKPYRMTQGINLQTAMGYDRNTLLSAAGGTTGTNYIENLNETALRNKMGEYTLNLSDYIRNNYPNAHMEEIVGGRTIVSQHLTQLPTSLGFPTTQQYVWTDIPDTYAHTVRIQYGQIDQEMNIADLAGNRVSLTHEGTGTMGASSLESTSGTTSPQKSSIQSKGGAPVQVGNIKFDLPGAITNKTMQSIKIDVEPAGKMTSEPITGPQSDTDSISPMALLGTLNFGTIPPADYGPYSSDRYCTVVNNSPYWRNYSATLEDNTSGAFSLPNGDNGIEYFWLMDYRSRQVYVRFSNTGQAPGTKTAKLTVRTYTIDDQHILLSTDHFNISGKVAYPLNVSATPVFIPAFMNEPQVGICRLTNNGPLSLTINSMSITGTDAARFEFVSGNGSGTVQAGSYRDIQVRYKADIHGAHAASITFNLTYDGLTYTTPPADMLLGETKYKPNVTGSNGFDFGSRYLDNPADGTCRFMNSGDQNLSITAISITGADAARFQIVSGGGAGALTPGQYRDISVRYLADTPGTHSANVQVTFTYDGASYPLDLPLSGETGSTPAPAATLWLDDTPLAQETTPVSGADLDTLTISINHPYADQDGTYCDQTVPYTLKRGATYAIVYDFGGSRMGRLLEKRQRQLQAYRETGYSDDSREVLTESLNVMGMNWMRDTALNDKLLAQISGSIITSHHRFGVVAQETGYYIDIKADASTINSMSGNDADRWACFKSLIFMHSALEHGVLEHLQVNRPAASTVKLLQANNSQGGKVYEANASNFGSIQPLLTDYTSQDLAAIQGIINNGYTVYLPQDGQISVLSGSGNWAGCGYIAQRFWTEDDISRGSVGMVIGGGYHGGYSVLQGLVDIFSLGYESALDLYSWVTDLKFLSSDPVDMYSGAWIYNSADLVLNGGKGGLGLRRSYYSLNNNVKNTLGYGWSHNYNIYAEVHSSPELGYGTRQPLDATAMTAASAVILDIMNGDPDLKSWMTGSLIAKWGMDQLNDNAVSIHLENDVLTYIKNPDGSYATPPGVTSKLVWDSDHYRVDERFSRTILFNTTNQVSRITDADGNQVNFTYASGVLTGVADGFGHSFTFNYTGDLLTSVSDSAGRNVIYGYDTDSNLITYTDPENKVWTYGYDGSHRILTLRNPLNITTVTNEYDSFGRVTTQTVPRQTGSATYNLYYSGYRNIEEDPLGNQTVYHYDEKKRLIAVEDALGDSRVMIHDGQNHVIARTDPRGNTTSYEYDGDNNLTRTMDALSNPTLNTYDSQHRLTDVTDPLNHTVHHDYDSKHHPIRTTTYPSPGQSIETSRTYHANGLVNTATDGKGVVTTFTYDTYGNPATSRTGTHPAVNYGYDSIGRMTSLTDQVSSQTSFTYDRRSLPLTRTDPLNKTSTNAYYNDGTLHTATDRKGRTTTFTYTPTGKPNSITYQSGASVSYTYDSRDNLTRMQDSSGTTLYNYDALNRLSSSTDPNGFSISYDYDEAGNLIRLTYPGGRTVSYTYDELNRLETVRIDWLGRTATYWYDNAGRLTNLTQFNATAVIYTYDNADRLTGLDNREAIGGNAIASYFFTLDNNGNRIQSDQQTPLTLSAAASSTAYGYNAQKNRLLSEGSNSFGYDDEGQLASGYSTSYTFDDAHRLTAAGSAYQFTYDGAGNRIRAVRSGVTTKYIYDASGNLLAEADGNNMIQRYYIQGAGLLAVVTSANQLYCYHYDATGNTVALTDSSKAIVNKYAYTPFGTMSNTVETIQQPFTFVGQYGVVSEPGGFYYMRARYYDSNVGRFVSEDPKGFGGGDVNLFAYVGNSPIMFIDPLGLELRVYNRPVADAPLSWIGANHAFLYSTETGTWFGTAGSSGYGGQADERNVINNGGAYNVVPNPNNIPEIDVMNYMDQTRNSGIYIPGLRDCHSAVARTLSHFGLENSGAPGGRLGIIPTQLGGSRK
jgi:RHS repeat-associated protein